MKPFPMSPRDFVWFEHRRCLSDGTGIILAYSTIHPECPERKGYVRGEIRGICYHSKQILLFRYCASYMLPFVVFSFVLPPFLVLSLHNINTHTHTYHVNVLWKHHRVRVCDSTVWWEQKQMYSSLHCASRPQSNLLFSLPLFIQSRHNALVYCLTHSVFYSIAGIDPNVDCQLSLHQSGS